MGKIAFTQYLLPDGKKRNVSVEMPEDICEKADKLIKAGAKFEIETLRTGMIHMDCILNDEPLSSQVCENGPGIQEFVKKLVEESLHAMEKL